MSEATGRAGEVVERLLGLGVSEAVLAPGSRSGPLALALHAADAQGLMRLHVRVDEREAGFLALGLAKASGRPVPVVTTSGTAVANLHPAMLEALHTRVPVIALTADRPGRLRGTGANQTTDQRAIFPGVDFTDDISELGPLDGPVQVNLEFDEPLVEAVEWRFDRRPFDPPRTGGASTRGATTCEGSKRGVVVAGDGAGPRARALADALGWPLLAEPSSGVRDERALGAYRLLLAGPLGDQIEQVVSLGHATLSRPVTGLLTRPDLDVVHLGDASTFPGVPGPNVVLTDDVIPNGQADPAWRETWRAVDEAARAAIDDLKTDALRLAETVWSAAAGGALVMGSSSAARDLDLVRPGPAPDVVVANRGLAGIDGLLSTAVGVALGAGRPTHALVGDLTFCHGANGLLIGPREPRPDLAVVVASDDGGAIFSLLEQGDPAYASAFERVYATPTGTQIAALCQAHGVPHRRVAVDELADALATAPDGISVIEVPLDRTRRRAESEAIAAAVATSMEQRR
ncbi:MAG: thiamine pyrophosphate-binding protein [Aeromicrobium sp.]|uniref:2-succinyl-5-enolpyruvyl-6-hydroxy-3- cyclohexene-1-carboxylate synthase n=1 Tax=Aeromicrobium sp. TaxID=1871063 RepID=UPI0039E22712